MRLTAYMRVAVHSSVLEAMKSPMGTHFDLEQNREGDREAQQLWECFSTAPEIRHYQNIMRELMSLMGQES